MSTVPGVMDPLNLEHTYVFGLSLFSLGEFRVIIHGVAVSSGGLDAGTVLASTMTVQRQYNSPARDLAWHTVAPDIAYQVASIAVRMLLARSMPALMAADEDGTLRLHLGPWTGALPLGM